MNEYRDKTLNHEQLELLAFEHCDDCYSDIDSLVKIYELLSSGYQQFLFFDDNQEDKVSFGIPLKTVGDLMDRYKSITGHELRYYTGDLPINAQ